MFHRRTSKWVLLLLLLNVSVTFALAAFTETISSSSSVAPPAAVPALYVGFSILSLLILVGDLSLAIMMVPRSTMFVLPALIAFAFIAGKARFNPDKTKTLDRCRLNIYPTQNFRVGKIYNRHQSNGFCYQHPWLLLQLTYWDWTKGPTLCRRHFQMHFLNENVRISIQLSPKFVPYTPFTRGLRPVCLPWATSKLARSLLKTQRRPKGCLVR